jgi:type IV secretion system protein VirD4
MLLGARLAPTASRVGFHRAEPVAPADAWWRLDRPGHGMVLAATGQGKFVNVLAPNVLVHEGPLYVLDPKGEIAAVTQRHRRRIGRVIVIDPFEVLGPSTDSFNPLDLAALPGMHVEDWAETLAWELSAGHESQKDPFWQHAGTSLVSGLIASVCNEPDPARRNLGSVVDLLTSDDVVHDLAVRMDKQQILGDFARRRVAEFLQIPDGGGGSTRSCVLASALQYVHCFESKRVRRCIGHSSLALDEIAAGEQVVTTFFVFPPARTKSHRGLLRVWIAMLFHAALTRSAAPSRETLMVIDEAGNLGVIDQLPTMLSYLRSVGMSVLHAWQSLGQLMDLYPQQYRTIVENCSSIQVFGLHSTAVEPTAAFMGACPLAMRALGQDQQLVIVNGAAPAIGRRIDYRNDVRLRRLADPNPRYVLRS